MCGLVGEGLVWYWGVIGVVMDSVVGLGVSLTVTAPFSLGLVLQARHWRLLALFLILVVKRRIIGNGVWLLELRGVAQSLKHL